jgi:predicted enzyme related to lactoylglutathione lyase
MQGRMNLVVFPVKDLAAAKTLYSALLGGEPYADAPYYVGFRPGDVEIGLDPKGRSQGPIAYWDVADIRASLQELLAAGAQAEQEVKDVGGGRLTALVKDADGSTIGLTQSP